MHEHEARLDRLQATRVEAPRTRTKLRLPSTALAGAGPSRSGETVVTLDGLVVGYPPGRPPAEDAGSSTPCAAGARVDRPPTRPAAVRTVARGPG